MPDQSSAASEHALLQEITAPLERLPDDPLALLEVEFPVAMRGYDRHAVDDYVETVNQLVAELHSMRSPESVIRRALERVGEQISGILQRAHETAAEITAGSRAEAEDRLEQARREAATMMDAAAQRVRELDADADRIWGERQRIIADAEDLAGQLRAVARDATDRFPTEDARAGEEVEGTDAVATGAVADSADGDPDEGRETAGSVPGEDAGPEATVTPPPLGDLDAGWRAGADDLEPGEDALELAGDADPEGPWEAPDPAPRDATQGDDGDAEEDASDVETTQRFGVAPPRFTDEDSTQIIPPASDAAQHRREP